MIFNRTGDFYIFYLFLNIYFVKYKVLSGTYNRCDHCKYVLIVIFEKILENFQINRFLFSVSAKRLIGNRKNNKNIQVLRIPMLIRR